jgi:hypothetical protein
MNAYELYAAEREMTRNVQERLRWAEGRALQRSLNLEKEGPLSGPGRWLAGRAEAAIDALRSVLARPPRTEVQCC